jgi:nitrilase
MNQKDQLSVGLAQIAPVWLDKKKTTEKIANYIDEAGSRKCDLIVFGEALLPGYPFWLGLTHGAKFNSRMQKEFYAHYVQNAVCPEDGDLDSLSAVARKNGIAVYLGIVERASDRGGHSLYCSLVFINKEGEIKSVHRKLQPTYEERLVWAQGDGNGLRVHSIPPFTVGGLNCWENWMPLSRTALYSMGENLHVAVWPGSRRNTEDISKFIAKESRSYVISVSGLMKKENIHEQVPYQTVLIENAPDVLADGGSCIVGPDGEWIFEPVVNEEGLFTSSIDFSKVLEERQNFDPSGHYSRPDVTRIQVNRDRQSILDIH